MDSGFDAKTLELRDGLFDSRATSRTVQGILRSPTPTRASGCCGSPTDPTRCATTRPARPGSVGDPRPIMGAEPAGAPVKRRVDPVLAAAGADASQQPPEATGPKWYTVLPGVLLALAGVGLAQVGHVLVPEVGLLTWSVLLGAVATNTGLVPHAAEPGLAVATKKLLRVGVALLGVSLSLEAILGLGLPIIGLVVVTLLATLLGTNWLGRRMGLGSARSLLLATGFAICGASAIAAVQSSTEADDEDVALAVAMVTLCGTTMMLTLPLLQAPLHLSSHEMGVWIGASVHDVGQVVGAASAVGAGALGVAVVVKLTRVLLLAPVVAAVSALSSRRARAECETVPGARRPPLVPLFVIGFLGCVALRSVAVLPQELLDRVGVVQSAVLAAALFGMGTGVRLRTLFRRSGRATMLAVLSTLLIATVSLGGVHLLAG